MTMDGCRVIFSGKEEEEAKYHLNKVATLLNKKASEAITGRLNKESRHTVIHCYAPTEGAAFTTKEKIYGKLCKVLNIT